MSWLQRPHALTCRVSDIRAATPPCLDLQGLWVHGNLLSSLPNTLGQLTSLRTLQLVGNRLQALPESISALTQLTDLALAGNQLTAAPAALGNLSELAADGVPHSSQAQYCVAVSIHATESLPESLLIPFSALGTSLCLLFRPLLPGHSIPKHPSMHTCSCFACGVAGTGAGYASPLLCK